MLQEIENNFDAMSGARVVQRLIDNGPFGDMKVLAGVAHLQKVSPTDNVAAALESVSDNIVHLKLTVSKPQGDKEWAATDMQKLTAKAHSCVVESGGNIDDVIIEVETCKY